MAKVAKNVSRDDQIAEVLNEHYLNITILTMSRHGYHKYLDFSEGNPIRSLIDMFKEKQVLNS